MKVVIPVAGAGTRLRPHTHVYPKPLLHVAGRPIIDHLLDPVQRLNPDEVIFIVGFRGDMIQRHVQSTYSFNSTFITQEELLGLGYALSLGVQRIDKGDVLVLLGDTIVDCELEKFISAGDYVLGLRGVEDPQRFGIATVQDGRIVELEEKPDQPKTDLAIIGLYYFKDVRPLKSALTELIESGQTTRGEIQFTDALQCMIKDGVSFVPFEVSEWFDCGKKETMLSTNLHLVTSMNQSYDIEGAQIVPPVYVHADARVENSVVGPNVSISAGSVVRNCILKNTIVGARTTVDNMILEDSLVGNEVRLEGVSHVVSIGDSSEINPRKKES